MLYVTSTHIVFISIMSLHEDKQTVLQKIWCSLFIFDLVLKRTTVRSARGFSALLLLKSSCSDWKIESGTHTERNIARCEGLVQVRLFNGNGAKLFLEIYCQKFQNEGTALQFDSYI